MLIRRFLAFSLKLIIRITNIRTRTLSKRIERDNCKDIVWRDISFCSVTWCADENTRSCSTLISKDYWRLLSCTYFGFDINTRRIRSKCLTGCRVFYRIRWKEWLAFSVLWVPFITIKATLSSFLLSIQYYNKVDPVQLDVERSLDIMSTYKVDKKFSIIYAGLVLSSFKSFDCNVWFHGHSVSFLVNCFCKRNN